MKNVQKYILNQLEQKKIAPQDAVTLLKEIKQAEGKSKDIAIIGAACRVPMAENKDEYWDNIINARNCFTSKPAEKLNIEKIYKNPYYAEYAEYDVYTKDKEDIEKFVGAYIKDIDKFDAAFFGIPPREAKYIDPQQRIFLETAWSSLEDAGYSVGNIKNTKTGVFVGKDGTNTIDYKYITEYDPMRSSGTWEGILASRINYIFNLRGPAMVIDTACSSGLVAIHEACNALRNEECDLAIAGGVSINAHGVDSEEMQKDSRDDDGGAMGTLTSNDNRIRAFDKKCSGTVFGEGCVSFLLKPLSEAVKDHDHIYGIIKGSAINSDGASNGLTAPSPTAQEAVIVDAWKRAKVSPETINYIETHGTGTLLGDPIEILGLTNAFENFTDRKQFCGIGSVKSNIGHIVGASGCANLLKILLAMQNEVIPPSVNFEEPNPHINFVNSPVYVVDKPTEWKRNSEQPRRAGVSAFGFSGTNCHLVVEEPAKRENASQGSGKPQILTISAKTETAMKNAVKNFYNYMQDAKDVSLDDICFTMSTGRGHYDYRAAILADNLADLKDKVTMLYENGLASDEEHNIFYKKSHVVSDKRKQKADDEISESELRDYTKNAKVIAQEAQANRDSSDYAQKLLKLCNAYVVGATIDWEKFYEGEEVSRVSLPTYPFDKTPYWGEMKETKITADVNIDSEKQSHPLVERCLVESQKESIYLVNFNLSKQWVLQEHNILGSNIVSGTTYIEVCIEALRRYFKTDKVLLKDVTFFNPLAVKEEDGDVETHIVVTKENEGASFTVVSKHYDDNGEPVWFEHAKGSAKKHEDDAENQLPLHAIVNKPETEEFDFRVSSGESNFGPRWKCAEHVYRIKDDEGETLFTEICLPDKFDGDLKDGFRYHPAMLDAAINLATFQIYTGSDMYLPFSYTNMKVYKDLPQHFYSKLRKITLGSSAAIMHFHVQLIDLQGNVLAEIEDCTVKEVNKFNDYVSNSFYGVKWIEKKAKEINVKEPVGNILIVKDAGNVSEQFADKIRNSENTIYFMSYGEQFQKIDDYNYVVGNCEEDYNKMLDEMGTEDISAVYHFGTVDLATKDYAFEEYETQLNKGLYGMFFMTRSFLNHVSSHTEFVMVSDYAHNVTGEEEAIKPANASFLALAKTTCRECTNFAYKCIDFDKETDLNTVFNEVLSNKDDFRIAYRNGNRYGEMLSSVDIEHTAIDDLMIKEDGVYVITGGTGGLGIEAALNFTNLGICNICLIARTPLPERPEWDAVLEKNESKRVCDAIRGIRKMEQRGSKVAIRYADVCNYDEMAAIFTEMKNTYGKINGVVHCAGKAGDGFLFLKELETFQSVIRPKTIGTLILNELTKDQDLEFFVMYSSIQTLFGGPGQGDYTAANTFMDSFSPYLRKKGVKAETIDWPGWSETGMAVEYNVVDSFTMFKSLNNQTAINALNNFLYYNLTNLIPGEINYAYLAQVGIDVLPLELSEKLKRGLRRYESKNTVQQETKERKAISMEDLIIAGKSDDEYTETEKVVALIYASVLNLTEIDIYESFNSMGGDSIIATEVLKVLNEHFDGILNISDMFTYSCIEEMAGYIDSKRNNEKTSAAEKESYNEIMDKFESGNIDINSMIDYFEDEDE